MGIRKRKREIDALSASKQMSLADASGFTGLNRVRA
jgi:hypothetical protein